ncbi:MAG: tetratricopeptide repeat protein [Alphaproteobacteria bacterium]|nr:tetratricopeptide repeat protein [Alphaproteobacteria bacterium]
MNAHIERSAFSGGAFDPDEIDRHRRMIAKITGFLLDPGATYRAYPDPGKSVYSRYAWAIARYRERLMDEALALIDGLIADEPENPWFHELRGQMLYETGDIAPSVPSYTQSVKLAPGEPLLRINLARSLLQVDDEDGRREAVRHLDAARVHESDMPVTWSLLGHAFEKLGDMARSRVARAEMHYLSGELQRARDLAGDAIDGLESGTTDWFRATDILAATDFLERG